MTQCASVDVAERYGSFVDGEFVFAASGELRDVIDPSTGQAFTKVDEADADLVDCALASAAKGAVTWRDTPPATRCEILNRIAVRLRSDAEELALLETLNTGKPLAQSRSAVVRIARYFEFFAGAADKIHGETYPIGPGYLCYSERVPLGLTAHVLPWNAPLQQTARGIAPALAAGNSVIAKPSEFTPVTCVLLAKIAFECGLPAGVWNVVCGAGSVGAQILNDPRIRLMAFTGSVATGKRILEGASKRILPVIPELGGKSPNIIFDDADLDLAVKGAVSAFTSNAGQLCSAGTRLLVQGRVLEEVLDRLKDAVSQLSVGPGADNPQVGPIITRPQFDIVKSYIEIGQAEGARLLCGGAVPAALKGSGGYFIEPTVFAGVRNDMRIAQEEIFGPVLSVIPFETEAEAIEIANDSRFGLVAGIWTQDLGRAHRVARGVEAGQVYINEYFAGDVETPFGGTKESGYGRERGFEALRGYTQLKTVNTNVKTVSSRRS